MILVKKILKKIISLVRKESPFYPRGMNSIVDGAVPEFVEIGKGFVSAPGSIILAHDASTLIHCGKYRVEKTIIGDNVFLGANAIIMPGVTVYDNAIIGAGTVVTKNVPTNSVVVGNPGKVISTVDEYIKKCEQRGVLYEVPESFSLKVGTGLRYTIEEVKELQNFILKQYRDKNG